MVLSKANPVSCVSFAYAALPKLKEYPGFVFFFLLAHLTNFIFVKCWSIREGINENAVEVRIAISATSALGGMVGSEQLTYDIWGTCKYSFL